MFLPCNRVFDWGPASNWMKDMYLWHTCDLINDSLPQLMSRLPLWHTGGRTSGSYCCSWSL